MSVDQKNDKDNKKVRKPVEVYSEKGEVKAPELDADEMKTLALAYAKYLREQDLKPGDATFVEPEDIGVELEDKKAEAEPAKAEAAAAETVPEIESLGEGDMKSVAAAYAKYLKEQDLKPGDETFIEPEDLGVKLKLSKRDTAEIRILADEAAGAAEAKPEPAAEQKVAEAVAEAPAEADKAAAVKAAAAEPVAAEIKPEVPAAALTEPVKAPKMKAPKTKAPKMPKAKKVKSRKAERSIDGLYKMNKVERALASILDSHDRIQDKNDEAFAGVGRDFAKGAHNIASTYRNSRRNIGIGLLTLGVLVAAILIIFDSFTVYEYAYNGKVLGYVKEQEEVTDVLEVAGDKLSQNNKGEGGVEFVANQNVTFNLVDSRGKSTDDADIAVNKLIYMTDIETEAYAVYDGDKVVAIVKDQKEAEDLLADTLSVLSRPDSGMELVSSEFTNELSFEPVNVLLSSVQSSAEAGRLMTRGGNMETFHIVEEGETLESLAADFGVDVANIFNEDNSEVVTEVVQGDKVCIRSTVEPVSVRMVETGKMKETVEFETVKKKSDEYYQGDTHVEQEGVNGVQIFEGTLTKVDGEVVDRDEISTEVVKAKKDKIILIGTKERPKTAPTGTYMLPLESYVVTSEFGGRWGRMHNGIDLGASTGTPIYASDGGTVIRATWYSGYGLCIDIDHENGRVTRYGHCSRLLVNAGDKVYQGQNIGLVGNTGNSFGSHLHFEVILDGSAINPRRVLDF